MFNFHFDTKKERRIKKGKKNLFFSQTDFFVRIKAVEGKIFIWYGGWGCRKCMYNVSDAGIENCCYSLSHPHFLSSTLLAACFSHIYIRLFHFHIFQSFPFISYYRLFGV